MVDDHVKENMKTVLAEIKDGSFAARFIADQTPGRRSSRSCGPSRSSTRSEETGRKLRPMMSWVAQTDDYEGTAARG